MLQGLWFALILMLLLLSTSLPSAFIGVLIVFYVPIILGLLYIISQLIGPFWFSVVLMWFGLYLVYVV